SQARREGVDVGRLRAPGLRGAAIGGGGLAPGRPPIGGSARRPAKYRSGRKADRRRGADRALGGSDRSRLSRPAGRPSGQRPGPERSGSGGGSRRRRIGQPMRRPAFEWVGETSERTKPPPK